MKLSFVTLDVFTTTRYEGNPLAIVMVPATERSSLTQVQKQSIAFEFNLSETVFLHEPAATSQQVEVDIFVPFTEIPFAGHPTIGTASYLLRHSSKEKIRSLLTKAGPIAISLDRDSTVVSAEIPHDVRIHARTYSHPLALESKSPIVSIVKGLSFYHIRLPDLETLTKADGPVKASDQATVLDEDWPTGVIVTHFYVPLGLDQEGRRVVRVRAFLNRGVEDPATGSAACALSAYLSLTSKVAIEKGERKFKYALTQGVEIGRRSDIGVEVILNGDGTAVASVVLSGAAITVMEGSLEI